MKLWQGKKKFFALGLSAIVLGAVILIVQNAAPVHANVPPPGGGSAPPVWLNRYYIFYNGKNYRDINTYDTKYSYVEMSPENGCSSRIEFATNSPKPQSLLDATIFFFYQKEGDAGYKYEKTNKTFIAGISGTNAAGQKICTDGPTIQNIPIENPENRRITFYHDAAKDQILSIDRSNIVFERKGDFKGSNRYFRSDHLANKDNKCPNVILAHKANASGEAPNNIWGGGDIDRSALLYAVREFDAGYTSQSYNTVTEPNNIDKNTCGVDGALVDRTHGGEYGLMASADESNIDFVLSSGLDENGNTVGDGDNELDNDAFIIFVGDASNMPKNPDGTPQIPAPSTSQKKDATCKAGGLGWVLCEIVYAIQSALDLFQKLVVSLLDVNPLPIDTTAPIYKFWDNVRNFANVGFILAFFAIIFSQATSIGLSNYGIKTLLPRLVAIAIGTNLSYFVCSLMIDAFNVAGVGVGNLVATLNGGDAGEMTASWQTGLIGVPLLAGAITVAFTTGAIVQLFPLIVTAFLGILITILILVARQGLLIFLVVISPLAMIAGLLPGTQKFFKQWFSVFTTLLVMFPLVVGLFAVARFASAVISSAAGPDPTDTTFKESLTQFSGLIIEIVATFSVMFIFKWAFVAKGILGRVGSKLEGSTRGLVNKAQERAESGKFYQRRQMARAARKAGRQEAAVEDYASLVSGKSWRGKMLRRRAAGGIVSQVAGAIPGLPETHQAGQEKARIGGLAALDKQQREEMSRIEFLYKQSGIQTPEDFRKIAAGGVHNGVDSRGNVLMQRVALNKIIDAGDAETLQKLVLTRDPARPDHGAENISMIQQEIADKYPNVKSFAAHIVKLPPGPATETTLHTKAVSELGALSPDKLVSQDSPSVESALAGLRAGTATIAQHNALIDLANSFIANPVIMKGAKKGVREALEQITTVARR